VWELIGATLGVAIIGAVAHSVGINVAAVALRFIGG
jgi:hypothetical protein